MKKIGIDFGTSFSTLSFLNPDTGRPEVIKNEYGDDKTPSVVYFGEQETLVGRTAQQRLQDSQNMPPEQREAIQQRTFRGIKRRLRPDSVEALPDGRIMKHTEIVATLLRHFKQMLNGYHGFENGDYDTTLTCPVLFTKAQREMLREAARQAGFGDTAIQEEPIAAVLGYGATGTAEVGSNVLVYDLGGGTFDIAFVHYNEAGQFETPIEPMGDNTSAGDDFDMAIYQHWERQLLADPQFGFGFTSAPGTTDLAVLHQCRLCKEQLTHAQTAQFSRFCPENNRSKTFTLSRTEFDRLIDPLVDRTIQLTQRMLDRISDLHLTVDTLLLIGGSCRVPLVQERLRKLYESGVLPVPPSRVMQADSAVALGATVDLGALEEPEPEPEPVPPKPPKPRPEPRQRAKSRIVFPDDIDDLQEAIDQCKEGGTVVISEGEYEFYEPIRIDKPICLVGETGDPEDVTLVYEGDKANEGYEDFEELADYLALLQISADSVEISACTITGNGLDGISCRNSSSFTISQCIIKDCYFGVHLQKCEGRFENCRVDENERAIVILNNADGAFTDCNVSGNSDLGIWVFNHGSGSFTDCSIDDDEDACGIAHNSTADFTACSINGAISICINSIGRFADCDICGNGEYSTGVSIHGSGDGIFTNCKIHENQFGGVKISDNSTGKFEDCEIYENEKEGIEIRNAKGIFTDCEIYENCLGFEHYRSSEDPDDDCGGVVISGKGTGIFSGCDIHNNNANGVWVSDGGNGTFSDCIIRKNEYGRDVRLSCTGTGDFKRCKIFLFVDIDEDSHGQFSRCTDDNGNSVTGDNYNE